MTEGDVGLFIYWTTRLYPRDFMEKEIKISLCTCAERYTLGIKIKALGHLS